MASWSTATPLSRRILWKAAQLHVLRTLAASHLHSYLVKVNAIHRSIHLRTRHLLEGNSIIFTITIGIVIRVRRDGFECRWPLAIAAVGGRLLGEQVFLSLWRFRGLT